jgi:tRNA(fMet)-specific endonuclease VapC
MTLFMLDTDSVSFALRGHGNVGAELTQHRRSELCVSAITVAELRFGADKRQSRKIHRAIETFLTGMLVSPFDEVAATRFGVVAAELVRQGTLIGQMDTLIAAHALSIGATLVTNNQKHFSKVHDLKIENWT